MKRYDEKALANVKAPICKASCTILEANSLLNIMLRAVT